MIGFEGGACRYDDAGHCVTCGDEAIEAEVLQVGGDGAALVAVGEQTIEIDVSLIDGLTQGDRVLIHGGVALARL
jgi:hydrogenase maturation factor